MEQMLELTDKDAVTPELLDSQVQATGGPRVLIKFP